MNARRKLKVQYAPADVGGTSFHWCRLPAKLINDSGLAEAQVDRKFDFDTDVMIIQRQVFPKIIPALKEFQRRGGVVIYWLEDQVFLLPLTSPVWREYGQRTCGGIGEIVSVCDAVTCSSAPLAKYLSQWNKKIKVLPHIMLKKWGNFPKPEPRKDKSVRILWTTTAHHRHDFPIVEHALKDICHKHKNVKVVIWGFITKNMMEMIPRDQLEFYGWVPIEDYFECLTAMDADIGIAPLEQDSIYNEAKTNLKWLEYGLMGYAPVVSDVTPYRCVEDGVTGLVVKKNKHIHWLESLDKLVTDKKLRKSIAKNVHEYVLENHTDNRIKEYTDFYEEIYYGKKEAQGKENKDDEKEGIRKQSS